MNAKKIRKWLVLGGLLTLAGFAYADFNVQDKGSYYNNASTGARTTAQGHATIDDAARDRQQLPRWSPVCDDTLSNGATIGTAWALAATAFTFTAESSAVITTYPYRRFTLSIRVIPPGGGGRAARRRPPARGSRGAGAHPTPPHQTTPAPRHPPRSIATTNARHTTILPQTHTQDSARHTKKRQNTHSTKHKANTHNTASSFRATLPSPTTTSVSLFWIALRGRGAGATNQTNGSWPDGIAVDLMDSRGQWYWAPYTSVRIRLIGYAGSGKPRVIAKLAMGS
jgi:hypothetical protein